MGRVLRWTLAALLLAACGGGKGQDAEPTPRRPAEEVPAEERVADVVVVGTPSFEFEPSEVEAEAGTISVAFTSEGGPHTFTLELGAEDKTVAQSFHPAETDVGEIELEAGTYTFYCAVLDHREEGMVGTLTVS